MLITIHGKIKEGKTTVAALIKCALMEAGIKKVSLRDDDDLTAGALIGAPDTLAAQAGGLDVSVHIATVQTPRETPLTINKLRQRNGLSPLLDGDVAIDPEWIKR